MTIETLTANAQEQFAEIDGQIRELKAHVAALQQSIDDSTRDFSIDGVKAAGRHRAELEQAQDVLAKAKAQRVELVKGFSVDSYRHVAAALAARRQERAEANQDKRQAVVAALHRAVQAGIDLENESRAEFDAFYQEVDRLRPYLTVDQWNRVQRPWGNHHTLFDIFDQKDNSLKSAFHDLKLHYQQNYKL